MIDGIDMIDKIDMVDTFVLGETIPSPLFDSLCSRDPSTRFDQTPGINTLKPSRSESRAGPAIIDFRGDKMTHQQSIAPLWT